MSVLKGVGSIVALVVFIVANLLIGGIGGVSTSKAIPTWYAGLKKPSFNPPNWIFAPVWTTLYVLMAVAAWMVWTKVGFSEFSWWVVVYVVQLGLNMAWSWLFFTLHRLDWAFYEVVALWMSILVNALVFGAIVPLAGWLFAPYLAWVSFASLLNFAIWRMNPSPGQSESLAS